MRFKKILKILFISFLIVAFLLFAAEHMYDVNITLFVYSFKIPLFILLLIFAFLGFIIPTMIFSVRERNLLRNISDIFEISKLAFFSKYYKNPKPNIKKIKFIPPLYYMLGNLLKQDLEYDDNNFGLFEKAKKIRYEDPKEAIKILDIISDKEPNALFLKRDILFENRDYIRAYETQQLILKNAPKPEKSFQKDILNILKALNAIDIQEPRQRLKNLEDAFDDSQNEITGFLFLSELLIQEKQNNASKIIQILSQNKLQDKTLLCALAFDQRAIYLLNSDIENIVSKPVLGLFYIHTGVPQKIKVLTETDTENEIVNFLLKSYQNYNLKEPYDIISKNLKLWKCRECNTYHNVYTPKCSCDAWLSLDIDISL